jgi:hypothetical protein
MNVKLKTLLFIATFFFSVSSFADPCEEYTEKLAQMIEDADRAGTLNILRAGIEVPGSTKPSQMVANRMLYAVRFLPIAHVKADGYAYCLGLQK